MKVLDLVLNEDLWFPSAAVIALVAVAVLILRYRSRGISKPTMLACGLNLFYGLLRFRPTGFLPQCSPNR